MFLITQYLTPKDIRPIPTAVALAFVVWVVFAGALIGGNLTPNPYLTRESLAAAFPFALAAFIGTTVSLGAFRFLQVRFAFGPVFYLANGSTALLLVGLRQFMAEALGVYLPAWELTNNRFSMAAFTFLVMFFFQQAVGVATQKLSAQIQRANEALSKLEKQQKQIVSGQEELRKELSSYLHDNLQSNLLVLGMQMQQSMDKVPKAFQGILSSFVDEVERIRGVDVRAAMRQLTPDIDSLPISTALMELGGRYARVANVAVSVDEVGDHPNLETSLKMAIFRISEQGVQNALKHSKAKEIAIKVTGQASAIEVQVIASGELPEKVEMGVGLSIIDSWCRQHNGYWSLNAADLGVVLTAILQNKRER
jgi:signal transduction histidine kinase